MKTYNNLNKYRKEIDIIDDKFLALLNNRMDLVKEIGIIKNNSQESIYKPQREKEILDRLKKNNKSKIINQKFLENIFLEIFSISRNIEKAESIAYLKSKNNISYKLSKLKFGRASKYIPISSINELFQKIEKSKITYGIIPIENDIEKISSKTFDLLEEKKLNIILELYTNISYSLYTKAKDIKKVRTIYTSKKESIYDNKFLKNHLNKISIIRKKDMDKYLKLCKKDETLALIYPNIKENIKNISILHKNLYSSKLRFLILSNLKNKIYKNTKSSFIVESKNDISKFINSIKKIKTKNIKIKKINKKHEESNKFFVDISTKLNKEEIQKMTKSKEEKVIYLGTYLKNQI